MSVSFIEYIVLPNSWDEYEWNEGMYCGFMLISQQHWWDGIFRFIMDRLDRHRDNWRETELQIDLGNDFPLSEAVNLKVSFKTFSWIQS